MKVKLLSRIAGPDGCHNPGDVVDLPTDFAGELVRGRYAEIAQVSTSPLHQAGDLAENAAASPPETASAAPAAEPRRQTAARGRKG